MSKDYEIAAKAIDTAIKEQIGKNPIQQLRRLTDTTKVIMILKTIVSSIWTITVF